MPIIESRRMQSIKPTDALALTKIRLEVEDFLVVCGNSVEQRLIGRESIAVIAKLTICSSLHI